jgi:hypothetical protein
MASEATVEAENLEAQARVLRESARDAPLVKFLGTVHSLDEIQEFLGGVSRQIVHLRLRSIEESGLRVWSPSPSNPRRYFVPPEGTATPKGI